jgi:hypothetical protein
MRIAAILLTIGALSAPAYSQDHSAHHPAGEAAAAPSTDGAASQPVSPVPSVRAEGGAGASTAMGCPMMSDMMQSMMKGMAGGSAAAGTGMPAGMGVGSGMGGMGPGGARAAASDQSLSGITYRAIAQRAVAALQASPARNDAEFARLAVALEEALADAAKAAAAFSDDPETRRRAQQLAASHQDGLQALRAWSATTK